MPAYIHMHMHTDICRYVCMYTYTSILMKHSFIFGVHSTNGIRFPLI